MSKTIPVTLIRREYKGYRHIQMVGQETFSNELLISNFKNINESYSFIFITCQSQHTEELCNELSKVKSDFSNSIIVSLQNGVNNIKIIEKLFPDNIVLGGTVWWSATLLSSDKVYYHRKSETVIGTLIEDKRGYLVKRSHLEKIHSLLYSEFDCRITKTLEEELYLKLLLNTVSPVLALTKKGFPLGLNNLKTRALAKLVFEEAQTILKRTKISTEDDRIIKYYEVISSKDIIQAEENPFEKFHKVSTQLSIEKYGGKGSNVLFLIGEFQKLGKKLDIKTPLIDKIIALIESFYPDYKAITQEALFKLVENYS